MEDIGEIFTVVASLAVAVLGIALKIKDAKTKKLVRDAGDEREPVRENSLPLTGRTLSPPKSSVSFEEGQRMFETPQTEIRTAADKPDRKKLDIDKKNLIIYSELLKPKFDE